MTTTTPRPLGFRRTTTAVALMVALSGVAVSCNSDGGSTDAQGSDSAPAPPVIDPGDGGDYRPEIEPADFVETIDNPYLPLTPGSKWVYEGTGDGETEHVEVVVTDDRKEVRGVSAIVVRDTVTVDGELVEDTLDWFAQDGDGNVWYLGEDSTEYEDGEVVSTAGSWEAGVDGALPGIVMRAAPALGDAYRQEFDAGEAEDMAEVVRVDVTETIRLGEYSGVLVTREWTPLEPDVVEEKYYAPGVGTILEVQTVGGDGRVELVEYTPGG